MGDLPHGQAGKKDGTHTADDATPPETGESSTSADISAANMDGKAQSGQSEDRRESSATASNSKDLVEDPDDPVSWSWWMLFRLYIFADKYSTRKFRLVILVIIQTKFFINTPRAHEAPSSGALKYAADNLPPSSPLFRFLADPFGLHRLLHRANTDPTHQAKKYFDLPSSFLALSFVSLKRHFIAVNCQGCEAGNPGHAYTHTAEDRKVMILRDLCGIYHEHDNNEEEAAHCALRRESRKPLFTAPSALEGIP